jgi:hypothetical protein
MDASAIERFSGPPLAERAYVSDQARGCIVRPGTEDLQTLVLRDLAADARDGLAWDAWRRADGRWTVIAAVGDSAPLSTWIYDPRSRSVQPEDAASHRLASEDVVVPLRSTTSTVTIERETAKPAAQDEAPDARSDNAPPSLIDAEATATTEAQPPAQDDETPSPARQKSRKGRRASVPRWDEILFGAGQSDS